jgi:S-(hydroxymethyl)glutathione dehydrogenase/alcohol dehydrogenase
MSIELSTRALVARGDGSAPEVMRVELDPLGARDVLVQIAASAVCRTELMSIDRGTARPGAADPLVGRLTVLGHAATGTVVAVGPAVTRFSAGDRVVVTGTRQCGECFFCTNGAPGACDEIFAAMERRVGRTAEGETVWSDGGIGAHAERMTYLDSNLVRIEGAAPDEQLALLGCGITSGLGAVLEVGEVHPGQSVAVSGCGQLGLWMVQAARLAGATTVIAIEPDPWRRERALALGATHALDASGDVPAAVRALTDGRGADVGLEAAGSTLAMRQSFEATRYGGTVVPTGLESETAEVALNNLQYALGSRRIQGAQCGGGDVRRLVPRFEALLASGVLRPELVITTSYGLDDAPAAYPAMADPTQLTGIITPHPETSPEGENR